MVRRDSLTVWLTAFARAAIDGEPQVGVLFRRDDIKSDDLVAEPAFALLPLRGESVPYLPGSWPARPRTISFDRSIPQTARV